MGVRQCGARSLIKKLAEELFRGGPRPGWWPLDTSPPHSKQPASASHSGLCSGSIQSSQPPPEAGPVTIPLYR